MKFQQNRQVTQSIATQAVLLISQLEPTVWSQMGFATQLKLWPFSPILPVHKNVLKKPVIDGVIQLPTSFSSLVYLSDEKYIFARCGPSPTYHLVPLAWCCMQYDTKPTRQCDSTLLIQGSLNTRAFSSPLRYRFIFACSQILADPLLPLKD